MPKVRIELPETFSHSFGLTVRATDLNYGNHLANDKVQAYLQEARIDFLAAHDLSELNVGRKTSLIQGDCAIQFLSEGFLGNAIEIHLAMHDVANSSFDFVYRLENLSTSKTLALAKTRMVCFDYRTRKVMPVTPELLKLANVQE